MSNQKRQPAGVPIGGQFDSNEHDEAGGTLAVASTHISLVQDRYGDVMTFNQIAQQHGVENTPDAIAAWAAENGQEIITQERIELGEDSIDFDEIASSYRSNGDHDIAEVLVSPDANSGSEDDAAVVVRATGNLRWNDEFTEAELDAHYPVVEQAYKQWFNADITVPDSWENFDVEMSKDVPRSTLCDATVNEAAWDIAAKWHNETDPGTYNSPYFGAHLRILIDDSRVVDNRFNLTPAVVPADLSQEKFNDGEALAIAKELHEQASGAGLDGRDHIDLDSLRRFQDSGVLSIADTEEAVDFMRRNERKHIEDGTISLRRSRRIRELSDALLRWVDAKPDYSGDGED